MNTATKILWGTLLWTYSLTAVHAQDLGNIDLAGLHAALPPVHGPKVVILGSSAQPPTYGHGGLMISAQALVQAQEMIFAPTRPYKPTSEKGMAGLWMAQAAIRHFDEMLNYWKVPHSNGTPIDSSTYTYRDTRSQRITVRAIDSEYSPAHPPDGDTLYFIDHYRKTLTAGDASRLFWISGADSFRGLESWTPDWKKMLDHSNWIIFERPGQEQGVDVSRPFALENALSPAGSRWLKETYFPAHFGTGWQLLKRRKDQNGPYLLVVRAADNAMSSTNARYFIQNQAWDQLRTVVPPSVVQFVRDSGYFCRQALSPPTKGPQP